MSGGVEMVTSSKILRHFSRILRAEGFVLCCPNIIDFDQGSKKFANHNEESNEGEL